MSGKVTYKIVCRGGHTHHEDITFEDWESVSEYYTARLSEGTVRLATCFIKASGTAASV